MARSQDETDRLRENLAKARMEADVDHLTGLPNRRAFERRLVSAAIEARAKGEKLSLAFCDVDRFKLINDNHGHDAGDRVLCAVAATLNEHGGNACFVARHGGRGIRAVVLWPLQGGRPAETRYDPPRAGRPPT